jgi:hypothetical protein
VILARWIPKTRLLLNPLKSYWRLATSTSRESVAMFPDGTWLGASTVILFHYPVQDSGGPSHVMVYWLHLSSISVTYWWDRLSDVKCIYRSKHSHSIIQCVGKSFKERRIRKKFSRNSSFQPSTLILHRMTRGNDSLESNLGWPAPSFSKGQCLEGFAMTQKSDAGLLPAKCLRFVVEKTLGQDFLKLLRFLSLPLTLRTPHFHADIFYSYYGFLPYHQCFAILLIFMLIFLKLLRFLTIPPMLRNPSHLHADIFKVITVSYHTTNASHSFSSSCWYFLKLVRFLTVPSMLRNSPHLHADIFKVITVSYRTINASHCFSSSCWYF